VSGGRAGWNIVTTADREAASNFGLEDRPDHADRYARATDFVETALELWDSWDDDAIVADKESGRYTQAGSVRPIEHDGDFYRVRGPLNVPRSPQGYPVLVQAGASHTGMEFAARTAEAVFTAQQTLAEAHEFYADLKDRVSAVGRDPKLVKVLPGIVPVLGSTVAEAQDLAERLDEAIVPEYGLRQLSEILEVPTDVFDLDAQLPDDIVPGEHREGFQSRADLIVGLARREHLTVRELIARLGGGRGHWTVVGTPEQIADQLQLWFESGAADGFNVMGPLLPSTLEQFVDHVIPILRERGLFRREYVGTTLREHYELPRPVSRYRFAEVAAG
jgi:FMN-dependent oxidoreductase (nitrilotriacetate monooxygenase family)